ncbi:hypothetical protein MnTg03_00887 [bacterium MnTg03]|nr:hypothetical protein MnTg03_00887 [bacterium MnTg03]
MDKNARFLKRSHIAIIALLTIHIDMSKPINPNHSHSGNPRLTKIEMISAAIRGRRNLENSPCPVSLFHRINIPTPMRIASGAVRLKNTRLKYGGPIEIFPPIASIAIGYRVPSNIAAAATVKKILFNNNAISRESKCVCAALFNIGARHEKSINEPPMTRPRKARMNTPRSGSLANACTEVRTPDLTRKVPSRLNEKAKIASRAVQALKVPRFSVIANECISAVPTSQGMNEAFSTGSQNHQPPQPNS